MPATERASSKSPTPPILSVVGHSGSGKTTLLEKLVRELKRRRYRLAVIKHHHQPGLQFDTPGKDTWRFAQAGADHVILAGPDQIVHVHSLSQEPSLQAVASTIQDVDLILTEGYKHGTAPKIEVVREKTGLSLISDAQDLVAVAADRSLEVDVPQFDLNDVTGLANCVQSRFLE